VKDKTSEFENFDRTMRDLMKVPHDDIRRELEAEKATKKRKRKPVKTSASDRDADKTD
jgi:hypothetical protein